MVTIIPSTATSRRSNPLDESIGTFCHQLTFFIFRDDDDDDDTLNICRGVTRGGEIIFCIHNIIKAPLSLSLEAREQTEIFPHI